MQLEVGQKIHSVAFNAANESIMHLYGCPHCYPERTALKRICPVCKKELSVQGFLVGRMWDRKGKKHLHISGCTECKPIVKS